MSSTVTQWFRSWHGAPSDPKWLVIAKRADVMPGVVSAIVWALLDHASQREERGRVSNFDVETYSTFSGFTFEQIESVIAAMTDKEIIQNGCLAAWQRRQPIREDGSAERSKKNRDRKRPEATANDHRTDQIREDQNTTKKKVSGQAASAAFEEFLEAYPKRKGSNPKATALRSFRNALDAAHDPQVIIAAARRYSDECDRNKIDRQMIAQAVTWLNQTRWQDYEPLLASNRPQTIFVDDDCAAGRAWTKHELATKGKRGPRSNNGWYRETEFPPDMTTEVATS